MTARLPPGTVIRRTVRGSREAGIIRGSSTVIAGGYDVVHGWIDSVTDAGIFDLPEDWTQGGAWRLATPEEAEKVRALFLVHAREWGPGSAAWIAEVRP